MPLRDLCSLSRSCKAGRDAAHGVFFDISMGWLLDTKLDSSPSTSAVAAAAARRQGRVTATRQELAHALLNMGGSSAGI